jgi:hypothetical protein
MVDIVIDRPYMLFIIFLPSRKKEGIDIFFSSKLDMDRVPITHEFGRVLAANFHHFEMLRDIMRPTLCEWKGCGSYLRESSGTRV